MIERRGEPASLNTPTSGLLALVLGACAIGTAAILVRLAEDAGVGPSGAAFWRLFVAFPVLLGLTLVIDRRPRDAEPRADDGRGWRFAALAGVLFAADLVTWHAAIVRTTAANATLLGNLTPVITVAFAWIVLRERPAPQFFLGMAAALAGAVLLSGASLGGDPERLLGDGLATFTAFWYALYFLAVKTARRSWSALRVMTVSSGVGAPIVLAAALALGEPILPTAPIGWLWIAGLGLFAHVLGQGAIAYGLGQAPAALASVVVLVQPVVAATLGWILFGEALGPWQFLGAALVLGGIVAAKLAGVTSAPAPPRDETQLSAGARDG